MIPLVCLFKNEHGINQQHKLKSNIIYDRTFKLFVACTSWRIPEHRSNRAFDSHPARIFEPFQGTN